MSHISRGRKYLKNVYWCGDCPNFKRFSLSLSSGYCKETNTPIYDKYSAIPVTCPLDRV